jgi:hypothetical protein
MRKPQMYQFEYLRRLDDVFFLGLKGPRGGIWSFPLTVADTTRLMDAFDRSRGAPVHGQRDAAWQTAREEVKQAAYVGIPAVQVIAERLGTSVEEATAWWERMQAEASAGDGGVPGAGEPPG